MAKKLDKEMEEFEKQLRKDAKEIRSAFKGKYADELKQLYGLSTDEIDALTPDTTDLETYAKLIALVERASRQNLSQAALKQHIEELGELAVKIAKLSTRLAPILV